MRRGLAILVAFVGASNAASGLPPRQPPPTAGARGGGAPNSEDIELLARVVEARLSSTDLLLPLTEEELLEGNATHSIGKMQKRMLLRTTAWLKKQNPALWLLLATVLETGEGAKRLEKRSEMEVLRSLGEDYHVTIVTTAALPWMTGTAVNPLLRAAHLAKAGKRVTLAVPWLHPIEQQIVFPPNVRFDSPAEQEAYTRRWLRERAGLRSADFTLTFYASRYDSERGSILPIGDITRFIDPAESDICVLEEPEHLSWYHNGHNWRHRFKLVVGVVHTNYLFYARTYDKGTIQTEALKAINQVMCHAYCDKVIKLSDTLQPLPRAVVCNVHGVRADFLDAGKRASRRKWKRGAYSIGKVLWAKVTRGLHFPFDLPLATTGPLLTPLPLATTAPLLTPLPVVAPAMSSSPRLNPPLPNHLSSPRATASFSTTFSCSANAASRRRTSMSTAKERTSRRFRPRRARESSTSPSMGP